MAEYRLTPVARRDLENIWRFTCGLWNAEQADRYVDQFIEAFEVLAGSPRIGPTCDHVQRDIRRWPIERHMIYFRITRPGVAIIRILHDRMDARLHFR